MASLATFAPNTIAVKGLSGSSLAGTKLNLRPSRQSFQPTSCRSGIVVAKYGDKSVYFDLEDLGNTTGEWDVYGSDAPSPSPPKFQRVLHFFILFLSTLISVFVIYLSVMCISMELINFPHR